MLDRAFSATRRCHLVNTTTGESIECLFNPTQLTEKIGVTWNRLVVPGLSHHVLQFQSTSNRELASIELYFDRFAAAARGDDILRARDFIRALAVPDPLVGAPPRTLFIWPGTLTLTCVVASVELTYRQFATDGSVQVFTAALTLHEILDVRLVPASSRGAAR